MVTKTRVKEIEEIIDEIVSKSDNDSVQSIREALSELKDQGVTRPFYNLESPYERMTHCCNSNDQDY